VGSGVLCRTKQTTAFNTYKIRHKKYKNVYYVDVDTGMQNNCAKAQA
jgi:hypothetical protein